MARPGITALIPTFGEDVVAIFQQSETGDDTQVLEGAHLMQVDVGESATYFRHPLENGRNLADHRIIDPVSLELRVILVNESSILGAILSGTLDFETTARDIYTQMRGLFLGGTLLSIQTRTATYRDQILQAIPHEETSRIFDGVVFSVSSSELLVETAEATFGPVDETDSDTVDRGKQSPLDVASETASNVLSGAASIFGA